VPRIRPATVDDAPRLAAIYDPIVRGTAVSFELEPPGPMEMARRIDEVMDTHPWLVSEDGATILGYAYARKFAERPAYRWSVETTVYVGDGHRGRGVGHALYATLLELAEKWGFANAYAGIALPNPASESLHLSVGFTPIGVFPRAGHKLGEWHDVAWWHRSLSDADPPQLPAPPPEDVVAALLAPR